MVLVARFPENQNIVHQQNGFKVYDLMFQNQSKSVCTLLAKGFVMISVKAYFRLRFKSSLTVWPQMIKLTNNRSQPDKGQGHNILQLNKRKYMLADLTSKTFGRTRTKHGYMVSYNVS